MKMIEQPSFRPQRWIVSSASHRSLERVTHYASHGTSKFLTLRVRHGLIVWSALEAVAANARVALAAGAPLVRIFVDKCDPSTTAGINGAWQTHEAASIKIHDVSKFPRGLAESLFAPDDAFLDYWIGTARRKTLSVNADGLNSQFAIEYAAAWAEWRERFMQRYTEEELDDRYGSYDEICGERGAVIFFSHRAANDRSYGATNPGVATAETRGRMAAATDSAASNNHLFWSPETDDGTDSRDRIEIDNPRGHPGRVGVVLWLDSAHWESATGVELLIDCAGFPQLSKTIDVHVHDHDPELLYGVAQINIPDAAHASAFAAATVSVRALSGEA